MSIRGRLPSDESRQAALIAARALLIEQGPQSVTLKAVASRIGRTHANLLHHFGSAAGLQKALAAYLAGRVCDSILDAVRATWAGMGSPRQVVDLVFDAFDREGGGALASWMLASGNEDALDPIVDTIRQLVDRLHPEVSAGDYGRRIEEITLTLVLLALGDALLGPQLSRSLGLGRDAARERAYAFLDEAIASAGPVRGISPPP